MEKKFMFWGHDITPSDNLVEAGLANFSKLESNIEFRGKKALKESKQDVKRRL